MIVNAPAVVPIKDGNSFTADSSLIGLIGGVYDDSVADATSGDQAAVRMTAKRGLHINPRNSSGTEIFTTTTPGSVQGNVAHGSSDSGNPVKVGAVARTANPTAVTDGQVSRLMTDDLGRLVVVSDHVRDLNSTAALTLSATTTETTLISAGGSGVFLDLQVLLILNTSATAVRVDIRDATGGTVRLAVYIPAGDSRGFILPGITWPQTTANNNWTAQCSASLSDIRIYAKFVKNV